MKSNLLKRFALMMLVYFDHGWNRLNLPFAWFYRLAVIFGVAGLLTGLNVSSISFWMNIIPLLAFGMTGLITLAILLGYFDRHRDGTVVPEQKKLFGLSGVSNFERWVQLTLYMSLLEAMHASIPVAIVEYRKYLQRRIKELGVIDLEKPNFQDWM